MSVVHDKQTIKTTLIYGIQVIPARDPKQCVCVRSISRKSRDLDALGSREVMVVIKVGIVVTVAVVVSE